MENESVSAAPISVCSAVFTVKDKCRIYRRINRRRYMGEIITLGVGVLAVIAGLLLKYVFRIDYSFLTRYGAIVAILSAIFLLMIEREMHKLAKNSIAADGANTRYEFFEDRVIRTTDASETDFSYQDFKNAVEQKSCWLPDAGNTVLHVMKNGFASEQEYAAFLRLLDRVMAGKPVEALRK